MRRIFRSDHRYVLSVILSLGLGLATRVAGQASLTWDANTGTGGAQDGLGTWDTVGNTWWNGSANTVFTAGDNVTFGAANANTTHAITLGASLSAGNVTLGPGNGIPRYTVNLGGNTLTVTGQLNLHANANAYGTAFSGGTLALARTGSSQAAPDIFFDPDDGADWGVVIGATVDVGTGNRYFRGAPQRNDFGRYAGDVRFDGPLTGSANMFLSGTTTDSSHNLHFGLNAANSGFTGAVTLNNNVDLALLDPAALSSANNVNFVVGSGTRGTLFLFGHNVTIGNLSDTGTTGTSGIRNGARNLTNGGTNQTGGGGGTGQGVNANSVLTITQSTAGTFNGLIADGLNDTATGTVAADYRTLGLVKAGAATLTLGGPNTFTGGLVHNAGIVNATHASALGTGTFTFGGYNKLQLAVPDGGSWTVSTPFALPATGTGGENELIRTGDGSPTAGTTARLTGLISGGAAGQTYTLLDSDQTSNHNATLILDNAANSFQGTVEIWRGTLAFTSNGALGNGANTLRVNAGGNNGGLRFDANGITLGAGRTINLLGSEVINTQANDGAINSLITGANLRKNGTGTLTLGNANTHTGVTFVNQGTLALGHFNALQSSTLDTGASGAQAVTFTAGAGTYAIGALQGSDALDLGANTVSAGANNGSTAFSGNLSGTGGSLVKTGTGTLTLSGTNGHTGNTVLENGSLSITQGAALGGGGFVVTKPTGGTALTVANNAAVVVPNAMHLPALGSAQTYNVVKNSASAGGGTELGLSGNITGGNANLTLLLNASSSGDNTTTYRLSGNNSFVANRVTLNRGSIVIPGPQALGNAANLLFVDTNANATLGAVRFEGSFTFPNPIQLSFVNQHVAVNGTDTITLAGAISQNGTIGLGKIGTGTLLVNGATSYTGGTTVSAGTFQLGAANRLADTGAVTVNGGVFNLGGFSDSVGAVSLVDGSVLNGTLTASSFAAQSGTFAANLSGAGGLTKTSAGTVVITSTANLFSGPTSVNAGVLEIPTGTESTLGANPLGYNSGQLLLNGGTLRISGSSLTVDDSNRGMSVGISGGTVIVDGGLTFTLSNALQGSTGQWRKAGTGTVNLTSNATLNSLVVETGTQRQSSGTTTINTISTGLAVSSGATYELMGGVLRTDKITAPSGAEFKWGAGTLTPKSSFGSAGFYDFSTGGYQTVLSGTTLEVEASLTTSSGSILSLQNSPSLYLNGGTRFNQVFFTGDLNLTATGDSLSVDVNPYLLRPFSPSLGSAAEEVGSLPLVVVGGDLTGIFDTFGSVGVDSQGFTQYTGVFTGVGVLAANQWYLEYLQNVSVPAGYVPGQSAGTVDLVVFHYRVTGYVPEPGTFGLLLFGSALLRGARFLLQGRPKDSGAC